MTEHQEFHTYLERLFPVLRSLTGEGARTTHRALGEIYPLQHEEIPSGSKIYDWEVPDEWIVREAYIEAPDGTRIADVNDHPLHLVNYAQPFRGTLTRGELDKHLYSQEERPDAIPYITSYYAPRWGFCLPHTQRTALPEGSYKVVVDTELRPGGMTISQAVIPGDTPQEVLVSAYTCHPGMANDELCGPIAAAFLARRVARWPKRRLSYRFLFAPETIGSLSFISRHEQQLRANLIAGYTVSNIAHANPFRYKRSKAGATLADRAAVHVLGNWRDKTLHIDDFVPTGSDERQFCAPGFNFPYGRISRATLPFPEYHSSRDTIAKVSLEGVIETIDAIEAVLRTLDGNAVYRNLKPYGEPQLGKYGLYPTIGEAGDRSLQVKAMMWVLSCSDGTTDLLSIAERSALPFSLLHTAAERCENAGILQKVN